MIEAPRVFGLFGFRVSGTGRVDEFRIYGRMCRVLGV